MKITHHENGDSEFELVVKVNKSCTDKHGTIVEIGKLMTLNILDADNESGTVIEILGTEERLKPPIVLKDHHDALNWILDNLGYLI